MPQRNEEAIAPTSPTETYGLPPILEVPQAAQFMGVNAKTLYSAIRDGKFPARRVGKRILILRDALLQWLQGQSRVLPTKRRSR